MKLEWFINNFVGVSVFGIGNCFWQLYLCSKANVQMMYFLNMLSMIMWHKSRSSVMKIQRLVQGVHQGVPEGVSEGILDVQVYQQF